MKTMQKGIAAAGFLVAAGTGVFAGEVLETSGMKPVEMHGTESQNYQTYYMEEMVLSDRTTQRGRAFIDKIVGVTCEWTEEGRRVLDEDAKFHTVDVQQNKIGCVQTTEIPAKWKSLEPQKDMPIEFMIMQLGRRGVPPEVALKQAEQRLQAIAESTGTIRQDPENREVLREIVAGRNPHALPGIQIVHLWNLSTNQVCLQTLERPAAGDKVDRNPINWGCFEVVNPEYQKRIMKSFGVHPA